MDLTGMAETIHSVHNYFTLGGSINMERVKAFLKRKQVVISVQTYLIDALGAMAFGLICFSSDRYHFRHAGGKNRRCNFYYDRRLRQERDRCGARRLDCLRLKGTDARPFLRRYRRHRGQ